MTDSFPAKRMRLAYFARYAAAGLAMTFWPFYIESLGMSADDVGFLFSLRTLVFIGAQLALAQVGDRLGRTGMLLHVAVAGAFVVSLALPFAPGFWGFMVVVLLFTPFESIIVPLLDARTMVLAPRRYGAVRLWGSLGFGLVVAAFGLATNAISHDDAGRLSVPFFVVMIGLVLVGAGTLPRWRTERSGGKTAGAFELLKQPGLAIFFLFSSFHWASITVFNIFLPLRAKELGLSNAVPGLAALAAVVAEMIVLAYVERLFRWRTPAWWMVPVLLVSALRWVGTGWIEDHVWLIGIQVLHFLTFGVWYTACLRILGGFAPASRRRGLQGLFMAAVLGGGGIVGATGGGILMDLGGSRWTFFAAAVAEVVALVGLAATWGKWADRGA